MADLLERGTRNNGNIGIAEVPPASTRETVAILLASAWLTAGLFLDGYAHDQLLTSKESFFTPWHAVLYSGYFVTLLAIGRVAKRRLGSGPRISDCLPPAYRIAGLGAAAFACGGVGDALWHTLYGFEHGTEALYSPTHLVLLLGLVLIVTGPFRAGVDGPSPIVVGWRHFALPLASLVLAVSIVAFFAPWGLYQTDWYRVPYDGSTGAGEEALTAALGTELVTTIVFVGAMLLVIGRWRPPMGTCALLFVTTAAIFNLVFDGSVLGVAAVFLGGVAADVILASRRDDLTVDYRVRVRTAAGAAAFTMVGGWHLLLFADGVLAWRAPFAAGTPVLAALAATALATIASPRHLVAPESVACVSPSVLAGTTCTAANSTR